MATDIITFRPRVDNIDDYYALRDWCKANDSTINSVFNSILPALAYAVRNQLIEQDDGTRYLRCDFGDILLQEPGPYLRK